jgi:hypothetical protein
MRRPLQAIFMAILAIMLVLTVVASLDRSVFSALGELWPDPWFRATLADAYFAFLTFYLWVWYKEPGIGRRAGWLALILCLGNFAMAGYLLLALRRLGPGDGVEALLLRRAPA